MYVDRYRRVKSDTWGHEVMEVYEGVEGVISVYICIYICIYIYTYRFTHIQNKGDFEVWAYCRVQGFRILGLKLCGS